MDNPQLTVRITGTEEYIGADSLVTVINGMTGILKDIETSVERRTKSKLDWRIVAASLSSPLSVAIGAPGSHAGNSGGIISAMIAGVREVEAGTSRIPPHFSFETLAIAKKLVSVLGRDVSKLTFIPPVGEPVHLSQRIAATVDSLLPGPHIELGSVEGRLETLSIHGGNVFAIWDVVTGTRVEGHFPDSLLNRVKEAFGKRISASGRIHFDIMGTPDSIRVDEVLVFPDRSALPQFDDLSILNIVAQRGGGR